MPTCNKCGNYSVHPEDFIDFLCKKCFLIYVSMRIRYLEYMVTYLEKELTKHINKIVICKNNCKTCKHCFDCNITVG